MTFPPHVTVQAIITPPLPELSAVTAAELMKLDIKLLAEATPRYTSSYKSTTQPHIVLAAQYFNIHTRST